jgi:hypothetical protein
MPEGGASGYPVLEKSYLRIKGRYFHKNFLRWFCAGLIIGSVGRIGAGRSDRLLDL